MKTIAIAAAGSLLALWASTANAATVVALSGDNTLVTVDTETKAATATQTVSGAGGSRVAGAAVPCPREGGRRHVEATLRILDKRNDVRSGAVRSRTAADDGVGTVRAEGDRSDVGDVACTKARTDEAVPCVGRGAVQARRNRDGAVAVVDGAFDENLLGWA